MKQYTDKYVPGQRFASEMEPELGLGILEDISSRAVSILFKAGNCLRRYSLKSAPVKRVIFNRGDTVKSRDNIKFTIQSVEEESGIVIYHGNGVSLSETELDDTISFTMPKERLCGGYAGTIDAFNLRYKTLEIRCRHRQSKSYGFAGCRVELIRHQFYIAEEVASRHMPRVLLSDETGLGKTIEAGLILHRLLLSERINRVLILVPDSLVHQWFVELYRRFNMVFSIFNSEFCLGCEHGGNNINPFFASQTGICSIDWLSSNAKRQHQVIDAGWDMLVIDEAHHLDLEGDKGIYPFVRQLGKNVKSMMLLTATPEQPGLKGYFSCLQLLDPMRFNDFDLFLEEAKSYKNIADRIDKILKGKENRNSTTNSTGKSDCVIEDLIDRYGPGRIIFKNTRSKIKVFPQRVEHLYYLEKGKRTSKGKKHISKVERTSDLEIKSEIRKKEKNIYSYDFTNDVRIAWLADFLKKNKNRKVLLICKTKEKAIAIDFALQQKINIKTAMFNESLSLIQRDRNAAWFSEKNGANILICSEIGSEGRNFQFAQHLVMFDLPLNPELIEQRIGRLDRIGQTGKIHIHVLCIKGSTEEIILRWYSEGINIFKKNISGVHFIFQKFKDELLLLSEQRVAGDNTGKKQEKKISEKTGDRRRLAKLNELIQRTKNYKAHIEEELENGRDKLLEFNSFKPEKAEPLINAIEKADADVETDNFILKLFKHFNIEWDNVEDRVFRISFDHVGSSDYPVPALKKEGMTITFDRVKAVTRGDMEFLTLDHPMVSQGMELLLGTEYGNSCFAGLSGTGRNDILLESIFILECMAPKELNIDRFMPQTPMRIVAGHEASDFSKLIDFTDEYPFDFFEKKLEPTNKSWIYEHPGILETLIPDLFTESIKISESKAEEIIKIAENKARKAMEREVHRLVYLKKINSSIREEEIDAAVTEAALVSKSILNAGLRLDAVRLIRQN